MLLDLFKPEILTMTLSKAQSHWHRDYIDLLYSNLTFVKNQRNYQLCQISKTINTKI